MHFRRQFALHCRRTRRGPFADDALQQIFCFVLGARECVHWYISWKCSVETRFEQSRVLRCGKNAAAAENSTIICLHSRHSQHTYTFHSTAIMKMEKLQFFHSHTRSGPGSCRMKMGKIDIWWHTATSTTTMMEKPLIAWCDLQKVFTRSTVNVAYASARESILENAKFSRCFADTYWNWRMSSIHLYTVTFTRWAPLMAKSISESASTRAEVIWPTKLKSKSLWILCKAKTHHNLFCRKCAICKNNAKQKKMVKSSKTLMTKCSSSAQQSPECNANAHNALHRSP